MISLENIKITDVLQSIPDGTVLFALDRQVLFANAAASRLTGLPQEGFYLTELTRLLQAKVSVNLENAVEAVLRGGAPVHVINVQVVSFFYEFFITPCYDATHNVIGGIIAMYDETDHVEFDRRKTEFVSLAAHQLRTPSTSIKWFLEMLLAGDAGSLNEKQKEYAKEAYQNSQRMVILVNMLLNVSRMELGNFSISPEPTDTIAFTRDVLEEFQLQIKEKEIQVNEQYAPNLRLIPLDPRLLRIIVQNIISNAVKYTPEKGTIIVKISSQQEGETVGGRKLKIDSLVISITDTGYGIPSNQSDKIFTKLFRADNVKDKDTDGIGLGLYLAKLIVDHIHGDLWFVSPALSHVEGELGKGTTFYLTIPSKGMGKKEGEKELVAWSKNQ